MRRLIAAPAVIVVAVSLLAQTSPPSGQPDGNPESSCSVGGRVVAAADGSPLKSARLTLVPVHNSALTDDRGQYRIFGLAPGRILLEGGRFICTRPELIGEPGSLDSGS